MKIVLTDFARSRHFGDGDFAGTQITSHSPEKFSEAINELVASHTTNEFGRGWVLQIDGYALFCKLLFVKNWTDARAGVAKITLGNERFLYSGYKARTDDELPVLSRWFEESIWSGKKGVGAEWLCLVLYNQCQLEKEKTPIDGDYGIVAILGQDTAEEQPMAPITMMRNALGVDEGGSGVLLDKEKYNKSVKFWSTHAVVKVTE